MTDGPSKSKVTTRPSRWVRKRKGHVLQFSLFSLLLLLTVVAAVAAKFGPAFWTWASPPPPTLPSPYYLGGGIQYFQPGKEFKLPAQAERSRESQELDSRQLTAPESK